MALRSPVSRYQAESQTVTQQRLLVLLYERLLKDLVDAEAAMGTRDRFASNKALTHAQEIIAELEAALDPNVWDAAKELSSLYLYIQGRLVRANLTNDVAALHECREAIEPLRDAWDHAWRSLSASAQTQRSADPVAPSAAVASANGSPTQRISLDVSG